MRIRRLQIRDLRRYRELDIDLAPGVTVVRGPNEAGKSTIQRAIELAITRRVTSAAADLESLRPWDAEPEARTWIAIEFEQDEEDGRKATGTLEKTFAGQRGTVDLRVRRPGAHHRPGARRPGHGRADRHPHRTVLPLHGVGPPPRAERPRARRDARCATGSRRASAAPTAARAGRRRSSSAPSMASTTQGRQEPGPPQGRRGGRGLVRACRSSRASWPWPSWSRTATPCRARASDAPMPMTSLAERRSMLEKARQAERLTAERTAAQERYDRFREAVEVATELDSLAQTHPSPNPLPVIRQSVERLRSLDAKIRELTAALSGEVAVKFDVAPEPTWRPLSRWGILLVLLGLARGRRHVRWPRRLGILDLGAAPLYLGAAAAGIGLILTLDRVLAPARVADAGAAPRRRDRSPPARSLRDGGRAQAGPGRHRQAAGRARVSRTSRPPRTCSAKRKPTSPGWTS